MVEENSQEKSFKTQYVVQNLKGDTLETWYAWQPREKIEIKMVGENNYPQEKIDAIKRAILSTDTIEIENSLIFGEEGTSSYWIGWKGAVDYLREKRGIEKPLEVIFSDRDEVDIFITLTNAKSGDGLSGETSSLVSDEGMGILRSHVTVFEADTLSNEDLEIIIRHEFGHVVGLAHSTEPMDLMYPVIQSPAPFISECDVETLFHLYTNGTTSRVICEN